MALEIKNEKLFDKIVSDAIEAAITNCSTDALAKRWTNAIDRAVKEIQENPYLNYDSEKNQLLILSPSNQIYSANGVCECLSFLNGKKPCWHRAAARIWRLYLEAENTPPPAKAAAVAAGAASEETMTLHDRLAAQSKAPYLKPTSTAKPEKIGNVRI